MSLRITWSPAAVKDFEALDRTVGERVLRALDRYADAEIGNLKKLRGRQDDSRLRVGDWRVLIKISRDANTLHIHRIAHRREAYRRR